MTNMIALMGGNDYTPFLTKTKAYPPEPITWGLSPTWRPPAIPYSFTKPAEIRKDGLFVGKHINIAGFAQQCTITDIFKRWGDEWARLEHERHGVLHRKTKVLLCKDVTP
jgi:hypothetical protein